MAKKTVAQLEKELKEAQEKLAKFEAAEGQEPENMTVLPEGEYVPKAEHEKVKAEFKNSLATIEKRYENLSAEHDELVLKYEASPDLSKKIEKAIETLKPKALLFKKMSLALGEVKRIPKNGFNSFFQYKYSQEGDILDGIRPILSEVGLMVWTTIQEDTRKVVTYYSRGKEQGQKTITRVRVKFTIACADGGESLESYYVGEGEDEGDKGLYKAYTGATKYFLTKNFLISSGDILQDDAPTDPEADTQRAYEKKQQQNNSRQNSQNSRQQQQDRNQGQSQQNNKNPADGQNKAPEVDAKKEEAKKIWVKLAGSEEGFEGFYKKQTTKGVEHGQILDFLNGRLAEKQKEDAETSEQPQNEPPQQSEGESSTEPLTPVNTANKNPDDMTPEEYVAYVEENLPFPLTPQEKEQILTDARGGNRNHRK
jgi:hypothetical protein